MARMRSSLWPVPVLGIVLAIGLGIGLPALDEALARDGANPLIFVFGGGPSAARDLLAAIAGSLISVTGLTFSFTVVALQLSSSQHSPRLLQTFVTDRVVQLTLAQLVATFVYALTVLRTVRSESSTEDESAFVPHLSITVGFALTLISVVALVLFLGHLARSLRVETMYRDVHDEATQTYARELPDRDEEPVPALPHGPDTQLRARSSGFVVDVDPDPVVAAAAECGAVVLLAARIGDSVVEGTPLASAWPAAVGGEVDVDTVEKAVNRAVRLEFERSPNRDIAYSLRKVVDIVVRALSPGTNDPTTAVHGLSHVSALLGELVSRPPRPSAFRDDEGVLRLVVPQWDVATLVRLGVEEPIQFASGQPAVLRRLAGLLREVAWRAPRGAVDEVVEEYLRQVIDLARESTSVPRSETEDWTREVADALAGRWVPTRPEGSVVRG
ncbi:Uncharacterized membrane protein [Blastococcus tunisiensis]|uniref:Uncharacterized membrane protein n=2 Tax=Blastococcus tunisiensis TaxID=1798228 RepID=A0A1I2M6X3_9ACTN|nr:Uncharacterized membrane protein [Blastococcus sp. DSM 46838]